MVSTKQNRPFWESIQLFNWLIGGVGKFFVYSDAQWDKVCLHDTILFLKYVNINPILVFNTVLQY